MDLSQISLLLYKSCRSETDSTVIKNYKEERRSLEDYGIPIIDERQSKILLQEYGKLFLIIVYINIADNTKINHCVVMCNLVTQI